MHGNSSRHPDRCRATRYLQLDTPIQQTVSEVDEAVVVPNPPTDPYRNVFLERASLLIGGLFLRDIEGLTRESDFRTVLGNDVHNLHQDFVFDGVVLHPVRGLGEGIDKEIQGGCTAGDKVNHEGSV